jgi:CrcB protein
MPPAPSTLSLTLWVAAGGAIGSAVRFGVGEWARRLPALAAFPWATLGINVAGSLALGAMAGWTLATPTASAQLRAFTIIGLLGGFTTFSTFAFEGVTLFQGGQPGRAVGYAVLSVILSLGAAALGLALTRP